MNNFLDSTFSYALAAFLVAFSFLVDHSSTVLSLGGILLLCIRLYADGKRAVRAWRNEYD